MEEKIEVILLDIGNSQIKSAEVIAGKIGNARQWHTLDAVNDGYDPSIPFMISTTRKITFEELKGRVYCNLSHDLSLPVTLDYKTPETLGADRIAAAVGATVLFPNTNSLIVDVGTCMTLDFVDESNVFRGGVISPGLKMRMKAMADYTSRLPNVSEDFNGVQSDPIGKSTKECLISGAYWAMIHEINGVIRYLEEDFTSINVILSGGDTDFFESKLKAHIFAGSKIVQTGLYRIWKDQSKEF
ncbi:MAG: hypothetical protein Tsb0034_07350 [Ekhidna sp.]